MWCIEKEENILICFFFSKWLNLRGDHFIFPVQIRSKYKRKVEEKTYIHKNLKKKKTKDNHCHNNSSFIIFFLNVVIIFDIIFIFSPLCLSVCLSASLYLSFFFSLSLSFFLSLSLSCFLIHMPTYAHSQNRTRTEYKNSSVRCLEKILPYWYAAIIDHWVEEMIDHWVVEIFSQPP